MATLSGTKSIDIIFFNSICLLHGFVPHFSNSSVCHSFFIIAMFLGFPGVSDGKEFACNTGDPDSILGCGRFPGHTEGKLVSLVSWLLIYLSERKNFAFSLVSFLPFKSECYFRFSVHIRNSRSA